MKNILNFLVFLVVFLQGHCKIQYHVTGDPCNTSDDCVGVLNAHCTEHTINKTMKTCQCKAGFVGMPDHPICLTAPANIGDECHLGSVGQCDAIANADCFQDPVDSRKATCQCKVGYVGMSGQPICITTPVDVGDHCQVGSIGQCDGLINADCFEDPDDSSRGICECKVGFVGIPGQPICITAPLYIGDVCQPGSTGQCSHIANSECMLDPDDQTRALCLCKDAFVGMPGQPICITTPLNIGDECQLGSTGQCDNIANADCFQDPDDSTKATCLCKAGFVGEYGDWKCYYAADRLGDACEVNLQCANMNANCISGMCQCLAGFIVAPDNRYCLQVKHNVGDNCQISEQCTQGKLGNFSECNSIQVCNCTEQSQYDTVTGTCVLEDKKLGDPCITNDQCTNFVGLYSQCASNSNTCACIPHSVPNSANNYCHPVVDYIGHPCVIRRQCINGQLGSLSDCVAEAANENQKQCQCMYNAISDSTSGSNRCFERRHYLNESCDVNAQCTINLGRYSHCSVDKVCACLSGAAKANNIGNACVKI